MKNKIYITIIIMALTASVFSSATSARTQGTDRYVSPMGDDTGTCLAKAPCKTFAYAIKQSKPGDTIHAVGGNYPAEILLGVDGTQTAPITIHGNGALSAGFILDRVNWLIIEGFKFDGTDVIDVINKSHFITVRNNVIKFDHTGLYVRGYSSHILVEDNEFYQTCTRGRTWSQVKGTDCEGGAFYGSSYGGGSYYIRNNYVHDVFNALLFTDDSDGAWMNSNVFISGNRITNVMDDSFEPEGDSFNVHFYNNTLIETHRMASLTTSSLGPVFVYGNYLRVNGNPTHEKSRYNSMLKLDLNEGYANGIWVFNNTVFSLTGHQFYPLDMISDEVRNISMLNNIFDTRNRVVNDEPSFGTNVRFDFNISRAGFGYHEDNGLEANPHLKFNGTLKAASPALDRATEIDIAGYFINSPVVAQGSNMGAFTNYSFPAWVTPPGGFPALIPENVEIWPPGGTGTTINVQIPQPTPTTPNLFDILRIVR